MFTSKSFLSTSSGEPIAERAALYMVPDADDAFLPNTADVLVCARHAEQLGFRIVTMAADDDQCDGVGGASLRKLIPRLARGEFDVILTRSAGVLISIAAARASLEASQ